MMYGAYLCLLADYYPPIVEKNLSTEFELDSKNVAIEVAQSVRQHE